MESHSHTEVIRAPIERCFDVLVDFARYPEWFAMIRKARIEDADPAAGRWTVTYDLDAILKTIQYTLAYQGERPDRLTWKMVRGDLKAIEGVYELVALEPDLTEATCTQALDVGLWVPGPLRRTFEKSALSDSVRELKRAVELGAEA